MGKYSKYDVIFKDEASIIQVNQVIEHIKERCLSLKEALEYVSNSNNLRVANLDQYAYLIVDEKRIIASGRTGRVNKFSDYTKDLEESLEDIVRDSNKKGGFVYYVWRSDLLKKDYEKKAYAKKIVIDGCKVTIGSGYPLFYVDEGKCGDC